MNGCQVSRRAFARFFHDRNERFAELAYTAKVIISLQVAARESDFARKDADMQMIKIQIPDKQESARALVEMSGKGRVLCFAEDVYIVPEPALSLLSKMGIRYQELGRGGFD